jgi:hypothetical protein
VLSEYFKSTVTSVIGIIGPNRLLFSVWNMGSGKYSSLFRKLI